MDDNIVNLPKPESFFVKGQNGGLTINQFRAQTISFFGGTHREQPMLAFHEDGRIAVAPDVEMDVAAKMFLNYLQRLRGLPKLFEGVPDHG